MKVEEFYMVLKGRKPIFVNTGQFKALLVFTDKRYAVDYVQKRSNTDNIDIEKWDLDYFSQVIKSIEKILEEWGVEWLVVDHPGESQKDVVHLKIQDVVQVASVGRFRVSFTAPSPDSTTSSP